MFHGTVHFKIIYSDMEVKKGSEQPLQRVDMDVFIVAASSDTLNQDAGPAKHKTRHCSLQLKV